MRSCDSCSALALRERHATRPRMELCKSELRKGVVPAGTCHVSKRTNLGLLVLLNGLFLIDSWKAVL